MSYSVNAAASASSRGRPSSSSASAITVDRSSRPDPRRLWCWCWTRPAGSAIGVDVFESADLPAHCARLDRFEEAGHKRVVTTAHMPSRRGRVLFTSFCRFRAEDWSNLPPGPRRLSGALGLVGSRLRPLMSLTLFQDEYCLRLLSAPQASGTPPLAVPLLIGRPTTRPPNMIPAGPGSVMISTPHRRTPPGQHTLNRHR